MLTSLIAYRPYFVNWQFYPAINMQVPMNNQYDRPGYAKYIRIMEEKQGPVLPASYDFWDPETRDKDPRRAMVKDWIEQYDGNEYTEDAIMPLMYPGEYCHD